MAIYGKIENPLDFCREFATACASLVSCTEEQGKAIAMTCLCENLTPVEFQRKYHVIQGKPAMKYDAMLAEFRMNHGGDYEMLQRTPEIAEIKLIDAKKREYTFKYTVDDAKASRWPWKDFRAPEKGFKDNWATATDMRNMLWARLVSDSLRVVCPELVAGVYTEEELVDAIEGEIIEPPRKTAAQILAEKSSQAQEPPVAAEPEKADEADAIEAEFFAANEPKENAGVVEVRELFVKLFGDRAPAAIEDTCKRRGVSVLHNLSVEQLAEIKLKLSQKLASSPGN